MTDEQINALSFLEVIALRERLGKRAAELREQGKATALEQIEQVLTSHGLSRNEIVDELKKKAGPKKRGRPKLQVVDQFA